MINNVACLNDYEANAKHMMSMPMFREINGDPAVNDTNQDFNVIKMKLRGLANLKYFRNPLHCTVLGMQVGAPIGLAAFPHQCLAHPDGELASARAAAEKEQFYCLSSLSNFSIEQVAEATGGRGFMFIEVDPRLPKEVRVDLVKRAGALKCFKGVIVNGGYQSSRVSEMEWKYDFEIPPHLELGNLKKYQEQFGTSKSLRDGYGMLTGNHAPMTLDEVKSLKKISERSDFKIIVKGIMCREDALAAASSGANAIWVSNGAHLRAKSSPSTISVLKGISTEVKSRYPSVSVFVDSGIRRGTDVMKCLAMGADGVFIGRPMMYALNHGGEKECYDMMCLLNDEVRLAMAHTSCMKVADITEQQVIHMIRPRM